MGYKSTIPIGRAFTMLQNVTYAVPQAKVLIHVTTNPAQVQTSDDDATWAGVTVDAQSNFECAAQFIRSTNAAGSIISAKRF